MLQGSISRHLGWAVLFGTAGLWATGPLSASESVPELIQAAKSGDRAGVSALLAKHADLNAAEVDGTTALHWSVRAGDLEMTQLLVRAGVNVNAANRYGVTPLSLAAGNGNSPILSLLLKAGAEVGKADANLTDGQRVLMLAARSGSVETVQALVEHGADVNAKESRTGTTALMWAAVEDQAYAVRALLKAGADINARSAIPHYPHTPPAVTNNPVEEGESYVGQTALPKGGWTALMYAARQGSSAAAQVLAESGAMIDAADPDGTSALELAIINAHYSLAAMLLDKGANPNLADRTGMAPLYAAVDMHTLAETFGRPDLAAPVKEGSIDVIKNLLAHGADPNARLKSRILKRVYNAGDAKLGEGATAFMRAARGGDPVVMRILLDAGADPRLVQKNQNNPIMLASGLHAKGSDINPLHSSDANIIQAIELCLKQGFDINAVNNLDETALHAAVGSPGVIRFLVDHGAKLDAKNRRGQTALDVALQDPDANKPSVAVLRQLAGASAAAIIPQAEKKN